jgi:hypothetical protein
MTQGRQPLCGTVLGRDKSPEIPSLSNGVDAVSPPLVVVGGITFYFERGAFKLVTSQGVPLSHIYYRRIRQE